MAVGIFKYSPQKTSYNGYLVIPVLFSWLLATVKSGELPEFIEQPQSQVISGRSAVTLRCSASPGYAHIRWLFDGQPLDERRHRALEFLGSDIKFLPDDVAEAEEDIGYGEYRCTATTSLGTVISQPAILTKPELFRFTPVDDITIIVPEGGYATLTCDPPRSSPSAYVVFQKANGDLVDTSHESVQKLPSGNLVLTNLTSISAGDFRCVALNPVSGVNRTSPGATTLLIDKTLPGEVPTANIMPGMRQKVHVGIGADVELECPSYGHLGAKIIWSKNGGSLPLGRFSLSPFGNLNIRSAQYEDAGTYTCSTATSAKNERQVTLEILMPSSAKVVKSPGPDVVPGDDVEMECTVSGLPKPELKWFHNGHLVTSNNEGLLILPKVSPADGGIYQCMATNKLGTAYGVIRLVIGQPKAQPTYQDTLLHVGDDEDVDVSSGAGQLKPDVQKPEHRDRRKDGKKKHVSSLRDKRKKKKNGVVGGGDKDKPKYAPSVPTVAQLSDRSVMLNWSVPDKGNGQIIKFFKVQYKEMNPERGPWRTSDAHLTFNIRRFEVSDLKSGGSYKFRILAVYEDDDNKNSANTPIFKLSVQPHVQVKAPDTAPTIVEAKPVVFQQNYGIGVKWQYKAESASPIEGFVIFYKPFGASEDKEKLIPGAGIRNDVIRDLLPNTPYNIRMQSFNTVGRSQFSNQVVKTTKIRDLSMLDDYPEPEMPLREAEGSTDTPVSGRRSNDTLDNPVILGVVLGALLLALLILIIMCWWKQRLQKRRNLAGCSEQKFQDQSQCIFADGNHTKPNGTMYPTPASGTMANGHSTHLEGHKHISKDLNSGPDYDMQTSQGDGRTKLFYGNNANGVIPRFSAENSCNENKFHHTDGNIHHGCNEDIPYMLQQKSHYSMQHCTLPHTSNTFYSEAGIMGLSNHEYSEPAGRDPHSAATALHSVYKQNIDHHGNSMGPTKNCDHNNWPGVYDQPLVIGRNHYTSLERLSPMYSPNPHEFCGDGALCQQHNQHLVMSGPKSQTGQCGVSNFGTVPGCLGPVDPSLNKTGRHKRKWKRQHCREHSPKEHAMRDQATNTDLSSNEGTLNFSAYCKSGSSLNSESEIYGPNCGSSFANNGSLESITKDSSRSSTSSSTVTSHDSDLHISSNLPAPL